jgi:hypothetical protein
MKEVKPKSPKSPAQIVEDLFKEGTEELQTELTKSMVSKIKNKMKERTSAAKILQNIDREIDLMKIELEDEIKSLSL